VVPLLQGKADVVVPDLRGFGQSDKHLEEPKVAYSAAAQASSVLGLIDELGLTNPVVASYDIGSRITQTIAQTAPDRARAIVVSPPVPGAGNRVLAPEATREYWYQAFHHLDLAPQLIDGDFEAVGAYLHHFWSHWSGPNFTPSETEMVRLAALYAKPGAFTASIGWYRAGSGTVARSLAEKTPAESERIRPTTLILWPEHDPLFPQAWSDRIPEFFTSSTVRMLPGVGHFVPVEAPREFASAIQEVLDR
jgi:pimeloyl-ACP methyl ester carboxylesterase